MSIVRSQAGILPARVHSYSGDRPLWERDFRILTSNQCVLLGISIRTSNSSTALRVETAKKNEVSSPMIV